MAKLTANTYGKSAVRVTKVVRKGAVHSVFEMDVEILLEGDFAEVYTEGNNSSCVPTDTMKNTVYALAKKFDFDSPEGFGILLGKHFVEKFSHVKAATVSISQTIWERIPAGAGGGKGHDHAFVKSAAGRRTAVVRADHAGVSVTGGIKGLEVMKTTRSGFVGFKRDEFTTLKDTTERIFGTSVEASWVFDPAEENYNSAFETAVRVILEVFAEHDSLGVQHTIFEMGERVLKAVGGISWVNFVMPNQHRLLANLEPFGLENKNEVFVNTSEPFGLIKGTIERD